MAFDISLYSTMIYFDRAWHAGLFHKLRSYRISGQIPGLISSFLSNRRNKARYCKSFLASNSPDILALCETNLDDSIDSGNISVRGYLPLI